jgi:hypothetical protein
MKHASFLQVLGDNGGLISANVYNSAWLAMVPDRADDRRPAWPDTLAYVRCSQLDDGGWGEPYAYYAHERTIATLAALQALLEWGEPPDSDVVQRALIALHRYAADLSQEANEPIGFELLLPRIAVGVSHYGLELPRWAQVETMAAEKMALVGQLRPQIGQPRSWWFSMEVLLPYQLAGIDDAVLNGLGSIASSPAATAAFLRARRQAGQDCTAAEEFLQWVRARSEGGAGVCYPIDAFEIMWALDNLRRAGVPPDTPSLQPLLDWLQAYWRRNEGAGAAWSSFFPVTDGDDTAVAYTVLQWAGRRPSVEPLLRFWDHERRLYLTYVDERTTSVAAAVHALSALVSVARSPERQREQEEMAVDLTGWLYRARTPAGLIYDKWHLSPLYPTARLIPALIGWDETFARECIDAVLSLQKDDGSWGCGDAGNLEETSMAVLGLTPAYAAGLLRDSSPLRRADDYLYRHRDKEPAERLWIGKSLYQPRGVVRTQVWAARRALERLYVSVQEHR